MQAVVTAIERIYDGQWLGRKIASVATRPERSPRDQARRWAAGCRPALNLRHCYSYVKLIRVHLLFND
jgi:hypothetical protein